jgi:peptidoglycan/LPS O-acetylase OafA/YrhL
MSTASVEDPPSLLPVGRILIAYLVPFTFGWLLYSEPTSLERLRRGAWVKTAIGLFASACYLGILQIPIPATDFLQADRAFYAIALWFLIFGFTGLFLRYFSEPRPGVRYASDSSYFLYLAHVPVMLVLQAAMEPLPWTPVAKIVVLLVTTTAILLVSYHYCVRFTFIGAALNGQRRTRCG